jgi:hypothetical protein
MLDCNLIDPLDCARRYVRRATETLFRQMQESRAKRQAARLEARKRAEARGDPPPTPPGTQLSRKLYAITEDIAARGRNVRFSDTLPCLQTSVYYRFILALVHDRRDDVSCHAALVFVKRLDGYGACMDV